VGKGNVSFYDQNKSGWGRLTGLYRQIDHNEAGAASGETAGVSADAAIGCGASDQNKIKRRAGFGTNQTVRHQSSRRLYGADGTGRHQTEFAIER
jgi:hypothetical protein